MLKSVGVTSARHLLGGMYSAIRSVTAACLGTTTQVWIEPPQITTVFTVRRSRFQKALWAPLLPWTKFLQISRMTTELRLTLKEGKSRCQPHLKYYR